MLGLGDRFNYGDSDSDPTTQTKPDGAPGTPFVQMLSTVDTSAMWDEFRRVRAQTLGQLPLPLDPALIVAYENGSYPTTSTDINQLQADTGARDGVGRRLER